MSLGARLRRMPLALSWGLPAAFALYAVLVAFVSGYLEAIVQERQVGETALHTLRRETASIQGRIEGLLVDADLVSVQRLMAEIGSDPDIRFALLLDERDRVLAANRRGWIGQAANAAISGGDRPVALLFDRARQRRQPESGLVPGARSIAVAYPVTLTLYPGALRPSRIGILFVERDLQGDLQAVRRWTWLRTGIMTSLLAAFALGFALLGRGLITHRARRIVSAAVRYGAGDPEARSGLDGQDEIGRIGQAFDAMADHLARVRQDREADEARVRESEERFRQLAESINEVFWLGDPDKNAILYISPAYAEIWGRSCQSLYREPRAWMDAVRPEDRARVLDAALTKQTAGTYDEEYRILRPDGTERWIRDRAFPIRDPHGIVYRIAGVAEDITERRQAEARVRESEDRFRAMADSVPVMIWVAGTDGACTHFNRAWLDFTGRTRDEELGYGWIEDVHPEDRAACVEAYSKAFEAREAFVVEYRFKRRDGQHRLLIDTGGPRYLPDGSFAGYIGSAIDVTEHRQAETQLRESEERFAAFMNNSPATAFVKDAEGRLLYINPTFERAFDFKERDWRGKTDFELWDEDTARQLRSNDAAILRSGEPLPVEETVRQADGEHQWITFKFPFRDRNGALYLGAMGIDITERKQAEQRARFLAFHDTLTGLPNRSLVLDRLKGILAQAERERREAAVLFVDLDRFKDINDSLGHSAGDRVLQQVSARLRPALREGDTVARLGGDEFLILLPRIEAAEDAGRVAQKLIETIGAPYLLEAQELRVGASVGVSLYPRDGRDPDTLIKHADAALYHAKNKGRNQYQFFDRAMDARAHERLALSNQLRQALERGEIEVHYQPQIDVPSGAVVGLEALARWKHPERGYVSPGIFVPIAEDSGLIAKLGHLVLRDACATVGTCRRAGLGSPRLAVNLSARQLHHPHLIEEVQAISAECGFAPGDLELELTESSVMEDLAVAAERMGRLADLGVRLALDDFGTGYSSLAYLKRFRIHALKIDQSFVRDLPGDPEDAAIVRAILAMGRSLGLDIIAEGVETDAQCRFLLAQGCQHMQGYLFARPLPLGALLAWLRERQDGAQRVMGRA